MAGSGCRHTCRRCGHGRRPRSARCRALRRRLGLGPFPTYDTGMHGNDRSDLKVLDDLAASVPDVGDTTPGQDGRPATAGPGLVSPGGRTLITLVLQAVSAAEPGEISFLHALFSIHAAGSVEALINTSGGAQPATRRSHLAGRRQHRAGPRVRPLPSCGLPEARSMGLSDSQAKRKPMTVLNARRSRGAGPTASDVVVLQSLPAAPAVSILMTTPSPSTAIDLSSHLGRHVDDAERRLALYAADSVSTWFTLPVAVRDRVSVGRPRLRNARPGPIPASHAAARPAGPDRRRGPALPGGRRSGAGRKPLAGGAPVGHGRGTRPRRRRSDADQRLG